MREETFLLVVMLGAMTMMLMDVAYALNERTGVPRGTPSSSIPIDSEHVGSEPEYSHGAHCIDSRSF